MKNIFWILIFSSVLCSTGAKAQGAYLTLGKNYASLQVKGQADSTLSFFYYVIYHADTSGAAFDGVIRTYFITNNNSTPGKAIDSFDIKTHIDGSRLNDGDSAPVYGHLRINGGYFKNGYNNLIVIWPTGAKSGTLVLPCKDTLKYPKQVHITGYESGINDGDNADFQVKIYPNPASTALNIENLNAHHAIARIRVLNNSGKEVMHYTGNPGHIEVNGLPNGMYYIELYGNEEEKGVYSFMISR